MPRHNEYRQTVSYRNSKFMVEGPSAAARIVRTPRVVACVPYTRVGALIVVRNPCVGAEAHKRRYARQRVIQQCCRVRKAYATTASVKKENWHATIPEVPQPEETVNDAATGNWW